MSAPKEAAIDSQSIVSGASLEVGEKVAGRKESFVSLGASPVYDGSQESAVT